MECVKRTITEYWKTIVSETTAGSYSVNLSDGTYRITVVGAGGGGAAGADQAKYAGKSRASSGGSGAAVVGRFSLSSGSYSYTVGAGGNGSGNAMWVLNTGGDGGSSSFDSYISCGGGTGGAAIWTDRSGTHEGYAGTIQNTSSFIEISFLSNGKNGVVLGGYSGWTNGGTSVYGGYGAAGQAYCDDNGGGTSSGGNGYVKIERLSDKNSYDTVEQRVVHELPKDSTKHYGIEHFYWNSNGTPQGGDIPPSPEPPTPLYYCYHVVSTWANGYIYYQTELNSVGQSALAYFNGVDFMSRATSSSQLQTAGGTTTVDSLTLDGFISGDGTYTRDLSGDLYI